MRFETDLSNSSLYGIPVHWEELQCVRRIDIWQITDESNLCTHCVLRNNCMEFNSIWIKRSPPNILTLLFYQIEPLKNGVTLILPSSIATNSSAPNVKRIFEILWGILEGRTKSAQPFWPSLKNCQNGTL